MAQFANVVDRNLKNFTNPPISGIRMHPITEPGQARGILAIYVPRSDGAPHRITANAIEPIRPKCMHARRRSRPRP